MVRAIQCPCKLKKGGFLTFDSRTIFNNNLSSNIENDSSLSIIIPNPTNVDLFSSTTAMSILYNSHMSNLYNENSIILNDDTNHGYSDNDTIFNDSDDEIIVDESMYDP